MNTDKPPISWSGVIAFVVIWLFCFGPKIPVSFMSLVTGEYDHSFGSLHMSPVHNTFSGAQARGVGLSELFVEIGVPVAALVWYKKYSDNW